MADLPQYQEIEDAYRGVSNVIDRLPNTTEAREAHRLVDVAEKLTYEARERAKPDLTCEVT